LTSDKLFTWLCWLADNNPSIVYAATEKAALTIATGSPPITSVVNYNKIDSTSDYFLNWSTTFSYGFEPVKFPGNEAKSALAICTHDMNIEIS